MLAGAPVERLAGHAGADRRLQVGRADLDAVQAGEVERDAAARRERLALKPGARPEGDDRGAMLAGQGQDGDDVVARPGEHHDVGQARAACRP